MERSAVNSYSAAGATIGVLIGLYFANLLIGTNDPGYFYSLTGILAMPFAAGSHFLASSAFRRATKGRQVFLAVSGWFAFLGSVGLLLIGIESIFP